MDVYGAKSNCRCSFKMASFDYHVQNKFSVLFLSLAFFLTIHHNDSILLNGIFIWFFYCENFSWILELSFLIKWRICSLCLFPLCYHQEKCLLNVWIDISWTLTCLFFFSFCSLLFFWSNAVTKIQIGIVFSFLWSTANISEITITCQYKWCLRKKGREKKNTCKWWKRIGWISRPGLLFSFGLVRTTEVVAGWHRE